MLRKRKTIEILRLLHRKSATLSHQLGEQDLLIDQAAKCPNNPDDEHRADAPIISFEPAGETHPSSDESLIDFNEVVGRIKDINLMVAGHCVGAGI